MPYDGDMTINATASEFKIVAIDAYDWTGDLLSEIDGPESITLYNIDAHSDILFLLKGANDTVLPATFDIEVSCQSAAVMCTATCDRSLSLLVLSA